MYISLIENKSLNLIGKKCFNSLVIMIKLKVLLNLYLIINHLTNKFL